MRARRLVLIAALALASSAACTRKDTPSPGAPANGSPAGASLVPTAAAAAMPKAAIATDDPAAPKPETRVRFMGRFVKDASGGMRFAWPGSAIFARFEGTGITLHLTDEGWNLFQIVVDGQVTKILKTDAKHDRYVLAEALPQGVHEIAIHRRTEPKVGETVFHGLEPAGSLLPPPPAPERRIELVGDSITTGYGNEGPGPACGFVNSQENEYLAYGALAARELHADHTTIAWSGKTLHEMREYFPLALPNRPDSTWDFAAYQPQVVVVNVGTNNFANVDPGEAKFVRLYHELIGRVRAAYPKAFIVCALGSMLSDVYPEDRKNLTQARKYMRVAVAKLKEGGDTNLELLEFPEQKHSDGLGCGFHPSLKTHKLMSDRLVAFLKEHMQW